MIDMLRDLMYKVDSLKEQVANVSREMEIPLKNQKLILEIKKNKKHCTEMMTAFSGLISELNTE